MISFCFKNKVVREIDRLPSSVRIRILEKLKFFANQENPLKFSDQLKDCRFGEHRFRIGDYRVLFDLLY